MRITRRQLIELEDVRLERVVDLIDADLRRALPRHHAHLGQSKSREAIRQAIDRARRYGIDIEDGWRAYVRLAFMFGLDFDVNPELPWAGDALTCPKHLDPVSRINSLIEASRKYLLSRMVGSATENSKPEQGGAG